MAKMTTTVTNIFAAFFRDLSCTSGFPPPDGGIWLIWDARDDTVNASNNYSRSYLVITFILVNVINYSLIEQIYILLAFSNIPANI